MVQLLSATISQKKSTGWEPSPEVFIQERGKKHHSAQKGEWIKKLLDFTTDWSFYAKKKKKK